MDSSGCPFEAVAANPPIRRQTTGAIAVWAALEQRLEALAAMEYAHQRRCLPLDRDSETLVFTFALRLARTLARRVQQATEQLPESEQLAARSAISRLFALNPAPRNLLGP